MRPPAASVAPLTRAALALYPPSWRARHGDEVVALLEDSGGGPAAVASVAWRALPAAFLAGRGIPVMMPSPEVPPVVHHGDGQVMSFWRYLSPCRELAGEAVIGSMLRDLHAELRDYPGQLPVLAPLGDIPAFLARARLAADQAAALATAYARLTAQLDHDHDRPLHGDAGRQPDGQRHRLGLARLRGHLHRARGLGPGRVHGQPAPRRRPHPGRLR